MDQVMDALVLHGPGDYRWETAWPLPSIPEGWALVEVMAAGICGSDLPRLMSTGVYHHPIILGHEFAGRVAVGTGRWQPGDRVAVLPIIPCGNCRGCAVGPFHCGRYDFIGSRRDGGFARYCAVPAANLFSLPDSISYVEGAFIEPIAVTLHLLRRSGMQPGARVLVFGGGSIGILAAQWVKILGAGEIVLADIRDESLAVAHLCGLKQTVNPRSEDFSRIGPFDLVIEAAGATAALLAGIEQAAACGTVAIVGRETRDTVIPVASFERLMRKELRLLGSWGYDLREDEDLLRRELAAGSFVLKPMVTQHVPLRDGIGLIAKMWRHEMFYCKVLLAIDGGSSC